MIMKHFFCTLGIIYLLGSGILSAQPYQSLFGEESTHWIFEWNNLAGFFQDTIIASDTDTIIDNMSWRKLSCDNCYEQFEGGYIREDLNTGKVWYKPIITEAFLMNGGDTSTFLAFDFSLSLGDSFAFNYLKPNVEPIIMAVSHIETTEQLKHIYFEIQNNPGGTNSTPNIFIEGIGSELGIIYFNENFSIMLGQQLICAYKDGNIAYANPVFNGNCNIHGGISNVTKPGFSTFSVNPNPATENIEIQLPAHIITRHVVQIEIVNRLGQSVLKQTLDSNEITVSHLPAGMYIVNLRSEDLHFLPQKLVIIQ
jgi:hypothetical protein